MMKIAIVGMEAIVGSDEGLDAFDRTVFDSVEYAAASSPEQTKKRSKCESKEGYPSILDRSQPLTAPSILRAVVDAALNDAQSEGQSSLSQMALIVIADNDLSTLQASPKISLRADSVPRALLTAQDLLSRGEVTGVIVCTVCLRSADNGSRNSLSVGEGAGAVLLRSIDQARQDKDRIYAIIDAIYLNPNPKGISDGLCKEVADACRSALDMASVKPGDIGYLEVLGKGIEEDPTEMKGLAEAYSREEELTCALGCVKANLRNTSPASAIASLIKTALCLYNGYIPATPQCTDPKAWELWEHSPFYVATESRPWFVDDPPQRRIAAMSSVASGEIAHLIMSEDVSQQHRPNRYLALVTPYCFPLAGENQADIQEKLEVLHRAIEGSSSLPQLARDNLADFEKHGPSPYALMIVGYNKDELLKDLQFMLKGLPSAFEQGGEVKTPKGSYFTANPLGRKGKVTFVYPGIGSAYIGLGQEIFHLFPESFNEVYKRTPRPGELLREKMLYPRSRHLLTNQQILEMELQMRDDIMALGESGTSFSGIYTIILRDIFKVSPDCALGYSMGEPAMMVSLGVWANPVELTNRLGKSITFQERLHGGMKAVWDYWGLDKANPDEKIWGCYTLRATPESVREAIKDEERVFLSIINTPEEVVIAGDPDRCAKVVAKLGCKSHPLNLGLAIHCDPARMEYDRLVDLYTLAINETTGIKFYSSSCYKSIPIRSKAIAHSIARALTETVDLPRLVNQAYEDGARIFIELGSRKFCCHMIERILKDKEHIAMPINVKGTKDHTSIVRVLSRLVSHRVSVDLSPLL